MGEGLKTGEGPGKTQVIGLGLGGGVLGVSELR